jgi:POT family proton-dependent oligopeptide transporter
MTAILLYYMYYSISDGGLGLDPALSASVVALYSSLVYLSGISGGFISDRLLGPYKTVLYGGILIMFGHISLTLPYGINSLLISFAFIIIGTGFLKSNISTMVGLLYDKNDKKKDSAYTIFYLGINIGGLISPILMSSIALIYNFHVGFSLAAIGMFIGLLIYVLTRKNLLKEDFLYPTSPLTEEDKTNLLKKVFHLITGLSLILILIYFIGYLNTENIIFLASIIICLVPVYYIYNMLNSIKKENNKVEFNNMIAFIPIFIGSILFYTLMDQGSTILAWLVDMKVQLGGIPPSWLQSMNPIFIMIFTPFFSYLWTKETQISDSLKYVLGLLLAGISFLILAASLISSEGEKINALWIIIFWAVITLGEILISPTGLALASKLAPRKFQSQFMSIWLLNSAVSSAIGSLIVKFYEQDPIIYFTVLGAIAILSGLILFAFKNKINNLIQ